MSITAEERRSVAEIVPRGLDKVLGRVAIDPVPANPAVFINGLRGERPRLLAHGPTERTIVTTHLWNYLSSQYKAFLKNGAPPERALEGSRETIIRADDYRHEAIMLVEQMEPVTGRAELPEDLEPIRAHWATPYFLAAFIKAQRHYGPKPTPEPRTKAGREAETVLIAEEVRAFSDQELTDAVVSGMASERYRVAEWRRQIDRIAEHPIVNSILKAEMHDPRLR